MSTNKLVPSQGVTLIELVMTMVLVGILSVTGGKLLVDFVQNTFYIPSKLNVDMIASDALNLMVEGDTAAKGLRFSRNRSTIQNNLVAFTNQDNQVIQYRLDTVSNRLYRSISGGPEEIIPYYFPSSNVRISGKNGILFAYYDTNQTQTANPAQVRWITLTVIAWQGNGSYQNWVGQSERRTAIAVKIY